jgi:predicted O-methyltransferase YrrM
MHGARQLAVDRLLLELGPDKKKILDVCSGDSEIAGFLEAAGHTVVSVDFDETRGPKLVRDVSVTPWSWAKLREFDAVVSVYGIQVILGDEAAIWREIRRVLKPFGRFHILGRFAGAGASLEMDRADPLRPDNMYSLKALGFASGLHLTNLNTYLYSPEGYKLEDKNPNAFYACFHRGAITPAPWVVAEKRYKLLETEGWMGDVELKWLYQQGYMLAGGTAVEVGSYMGRSTCALLAGIREGQGGRLAVVDTFDGRGTSKAQSTLLQFKQNISARKLPTPFVFQGESTSDRLELIFQNKSLEFVFIDATHTYDAVMADIQMWSRKVAPGGIISGHDYCAGWPGVVEAVDGFFGKSNVDSPDRKDTGIWMVKM